MSRISNDWKCAFKADHAVIIPLIVKEILDEHIAHKLA